MAATNDKESILVFDKRLLPKCQKGQCHSSTDLRSGCVSNHICCYECWCNASASSLHAICPVCSASLSLYVTQLPKHTINWDEVGKLMKRKRRQQLGTCSECEQLAYLRCDPTHCSKLFCDDHYEQHLRNEFINVVDHQEKLKNVVERIEKPNNILDEQREKLLNVTNEYYKNIIDEVKRQKDVVQSEIRQLCEHNATTSNDYESLIRDFQNVINRHRNPENLEIGPLASWKNDINRAIKKAEEIQKERDSVQFNFTFVGAIVPTLKSYTLPRIGFLHESINDSSEVSFDVAFQLVTKCLQKTSTMTTYSCKDEILYRPRAVCNINNEYFVITSFHNNQLQFFNKTFNHVLSHKCQSPHDLTSVKATENNNYYLYVTTSGKTDRLIRLTIYYDETTMLKVIEEEPLYDENIGEPNGIAWVKSMNALCVCDGSTGKVIVRASNKEKDDEIDFTPATTSQKPYSIRCSTSQVYVGDISHQLIYVFDKYLKYVKTIDDKTSFHFQPTTICVLHTPHEFILTSSEDLRHINIYDAKGEGEFLGTSFKFSGCISSICTFRHYLLIINFTMNCLHVIELDKRLFGIN